MQSCHELRSDDRGEYIPLNNEQMRIEEPIYTILNARLFAAFKSVAAKLVSNAFLKAPSIRL